MKKGVKGFVCGVVSTVIIASGLAFAAGNWKTIDVLENDINVLVDGKYISESNFVYNDTTYLPLRAVAEAVGKPVDYDDATNTAYIGNREAINTVEIKNYSDFPWCPDFGEYTGAALKEDRKYKDYYYKTAPDDWIWPDVEEYQGHIDMYVSLLKSMGYQEGRFSGVDNTIILKNDKHSISIEYSVAQSIAYVRVYPEKYERSVIDESFIPVG